MKKAEAIEAVRKKWGFLPYGGVLFSLYNDDEEIPEGVVNYELSINPSRSPGSFAIVHPKIAEALNGVDINKEKIITSDPGDEVDHLYRKD